MFLHTHTHILFRIFLGLCFSTGQLTDTGEKMGVDDTQQMTLQHSNLDANADGLYFTVFKTVKVQLHWLNGVFIDVVWW